MVSDDTCNEGGQWDMGVSEVAAMCSLRGQNHPPTPLTILPASCLVPCSDTAVINALGKDDDNNDHN